MSLFPHSKRAQRPAQGGFALVIALSLMAFVLLLLLSITTLVQVESQSSRIQMQRMEAEQSALLGLQLALGQLQKAAGPDQRVTATADVLSSDTSKEPVDGRHRWAGVWDTSGYSPATPDTKTFKRWLVSSSATNGLVLDTDAKGAAFTQQHVIFKAVDASGNPDTSNDVIVEKIPVSSASSSSEASYAYWVEDEGVKADLAWNEGTFTDDERKQAARLSSAPGVDYEVFASDDSSPFKDEVTHPIEKDAPNNDNSWLANLSKATDPAGMPLVTGRTTDATNWLKAFRHDVTFGSRAVLADVKNGGLRRDLSLAFEMDEDAESENATLFNQQAGEFVAGNDSLAASENAPGFTIKDRFLFRDFQGAGNTFSDAITVSETVVRGPSWWLLRDYANLYKRLSTSGSDYALDARAYFPNRTTANPKNNLFDIHAQKNTADASIKVIALNRETNSNGAYAFRPARASYAPVLLGVNAVYSLVYTGGQLKLVVDPFFIIWNPYDTKITADKFAVTLENGLAGGVRFRITDPDGNQTTHGKKPRRGTWQETGTDTSFADYAKNRFENETGLAGDANLSYLITDLAMNPGEVLIYSPPKEDGPDQRSSNANVKNDELLPGMNYDVTESGIFFDEFPDVTGGNWAPILVDSTQSGQYTIEVMFNILSQSNYAIKNFIETNLPSSGRKADELTTEVNFGDHVSGKEFRLNLGGGQYATNVDKGERGYSLSYAFDELGPAKESFGILSMLTLPTDYDEADTALEVFSQLNATAAVSTNTERWGQGPLNIVVKTVSAYGYNNLTNAVGIDLDALGSGNNGFYGKSYDLADGDSFFPLLSIPKAPLHSLVQLSGANLGTRLFEPTHAIGNSWRPPYIPKDSIYSTYDIPQSGLNTFNDTSWQINDALFDRYYFSGIAPGVSTDIETTLQSFYGDTPEVAEANPALEPYRPDGMTAAQIKDLLTPADGYQKMGAYSLINGAFNVNSTSVAAWSAFLRGNKALAIESIQGTTDSATGTPFPLSSSASDTNSNNGWEKFSRISAPDIKTLAEKIVDEVRKRGPFMSLADFVNRRISDDSRSAQGAIQEAIEQAGINGNQSSGIRATTSDTIPNYSDYANPFAYADASYIGARNNATGVPLEINQANILLPIAPKLTARSDTFKIRAYGEVVSMGGDVVQAVCEATVQRVPEYVNTVDEPWVENYTNPLFPSGALQLNSINQTFGRRFKIVSIRWLDQAEI
jgi:Tfp pilus assembly protein PilX